MEIDIFSKVFGSLFIGKKPTLDEVSMMGTFLIVNGSSGGLIMSEHLHDLF